MTLFLLFLIPAFVSLVLFVLGRHRVTIGEFSLLLVVQGAVVGVSWYMFDEEAQGSTKDVAVYNGRVREKRREEVSCSHKYECRCRRDCGGTGSNRTRGTCPEKCDTCYEHPFDVAWNVHSTSGDVLTLRSPDPQGLREPELWKQVRKGEPMAVRRSYENHLLTAPRAFLPSPPKRGFPIPPYPLNVRDGYRLDRLMTVGLELPDAEAWNKGISELTADLGSRANVVVVAVQELPREYLDALRWSWRGGKENDVVLVASLDAQKRIQWADVLAWSTDERLHVVLRDAVQALGTFQRKPVLDAIRTSVEKHYARRPLSDFDYLRSRSVLTPRQLLSALSISLVLSVLLGLYFLFNGERPTRMQAIWGTLVTALIVIAAVGVLGGWLVSRFRQDWREQELDISVKYHQAQTRMQRLSSELKGTLALPADDVARLDELVRQALASRTGERTEELLTFLEEHRPDMKGQARSTIEAAWRTYQSNAAELEDRKRAYLARLAHFPESMLAGALGFPQVDFDAHRLQAAPGEPQPVNK